MHCLCESRPILTSMEIKTSSIPYICNLLATNCNKFEMFESPYCQVNIDPPSINNPLLCMFFAKRLVQEHHDQGAGDHAPYFSNLLDFCNFDI